LVDVVDKKTRSRMMAGIKGANTQPELRIRQALHREGFRFRLHGRQLPGKPDVVFSQFAAVLFVHGCYWHRHEGCRLSTTPRTNPQFWSDKFSANVKRDIAVRNALADEGWRIGIVWECALRSKDIEPVAQAIATWLRSDKPFLEVPAIQA
jgi:DNA mismatch endonuclease, patch repair protein